MCDLVPVATGTVLEPSFGNGNFLVEIYKRKLALCHTEQDVLRAVRSVYGVELLSDNVREAKKRLWEIINACGIPLSETTMLKITIAMNVNLQQGDMLTMTKADGSPLCFIDWREYV